MLVDHSNESSQGQISENEIYLFRVIRNFSKTFDISAKECHKEMKQQKNFVGQIGLYNEFEQLPDLDQHLIIQFRSLYN